MLRGVESPSVWAMHQSHDDRGGEQRLRDDHRGRREQQAGCAQRAGARQQQIKHEADHDRRQAEKRVGQHDNGLPPAKARDRKPRTKRRADRERDQAR
jgi:hypothetical protein